jgi:hypothetical protein
MENVSMGRKGLTRNYGRSSNKSYKDGNIYLCNISLPVAFEIFNSASFEEAKKLLTNFVTCGIGMMMMTQIGISSKPQNAEWVDQLRSIKDIKQNIINSKVGLTVSACIGLTAAYPSAIFDLDIKEEEIGEYFCSLAHEMVESNTGNTKRIKPSKTEWLAYARGEMGAAKGQMLSCPTTNIERLNINNSQIISYSVQDALNNLGFAKETYFKYGINADNIITYIRPMFLKDKGGLPIEKLVYNEPNFVKSKIQNEIFGDCLVRIESVKDSLEKGVIPDRPMSKEFLAKNLSKMQLFAYNVAVRTGDTPMIKKLTSLAMQNSKQSES